MEVITRFAPSPTGLLHIGGARTALFNWLFAHHHKGKFLLRIEDTDKARSTKEFEDKIIKTLQWMELNWDNEIMHQSHRINRHLEVAQILLEKGHAYYCKCSELEIAQYRKHAKENKLPLCYNGKCRDLNIKTNNLPLRLKVNHTGKTSINDLLQDQVTVNNTEIDDMILLRSDGTPTYMLSVVVDDHDMNITHIIRGDDHLTNAFRQIKIYETLMWNIPKFCHIPLVHDKDGSKLSKRNKAAFVGEYKNHGILPQAFVNALLLLGWAHGNDEIIDIENAILWFNEKGMGKSAAKFDAEKLEHLNHHYIKNMDNKELLKILLNTFTKNKQLKNKNVQLRLLKGLTGIKTRSKTILDVMAFSNIYFEDFLNTKTNLNHDDFNITKEENTYLQLIISQLNILASWEEGIIESSLRELSLKHNIKLGLFMKPLRIALTNSKTSPSLFEIMTVLGIDEVIKRINHIN